MYKGQHNPNAGENVTNYSSSRPVGKGMSAGVADGLAHAESMDVKNAEGVCENQRPKAKRGPAGKGMVIGT